MKLLRRQFVPTVFYALTLRYKYFIIIRLSNLSVYFRENPDSVTTN
jgi:hypothetical protein